MGPGFDTFGMAVSLTNRFHVAPAVDCQDSIQVHLNPALVKTSSPPSTNPAKNLFFTILDNSLKDLNHTRAAIQLAIDVDIPLERGLGSSATAVVAALVTANQLAGNPWSQADLIQKAIAIEGHPDNVVPAILGGIAFWDDIVGACKLPWPEDWCIFIVVPHYPVITHDARKVLPAHVSMSDTVFTLRKASLLTYALLQADKVAFQSALEDRLHQPYRQQLIAEFEPVRQVVLSHGGLGSVISGSGSCVAFYAQSQKAAHVKQGVQQLLQQNFTDAQLLEVFVDTEGTRLTNS
jgi:homoserine kinase